MGKSRDYALVEDDEEDRKRVMKSPVRSSLAFRVGLAVLALIIFWGWPIVSIPAGHIGVVDLFGFVEKSVIPAGVHLKTVFADVHTFSIKTQLFDVTQDA